MADGSDPQERIQRYIVYAAGTTGLFVTHPVNKQRAISTPRYCQVDTNPARGSSSLRPLKHSR